MIPLAVLTSFLIVGASDLVTERIPNFITFPLIASALIVSTNGGTLVESLLGAALCGGTLLIVTFLCEEAARSGWGGGAGGGDVKAAAAVGAWFGIHGVVIVAAACALASFVMTARGLRSRILQGVPLGPYLALTVTVAAVVQWG